MKIYHYLQVCFVLRVSVNLMFFSSFLKWRHLSQFQSGCLIIVIIIMYKVTIFKFYLVRSFRNYKFKLQFILLGLMCVLVSVCVWIKLKFRITMTFDKSYVFDRDKRAPKEGKHEIEVVRGEWLARLSRQERSVELCCHWRIRERTQRFGSSFPPESL